MHLHRSAVGPRGAGRREWYQQNQFWWSHGGAGPVSSSPRAGCLPRIGGALALDFANSTTGRGTDHFVEHLFDYEDLLRWSVFNEVLTPEAAAALQAGVPADAQADAFAAAMRARALLNGVFDALALGR